MTSSAQNEIVYASGVRTESDVRDGVWKDLPQPRSWKVFAKSCEREAERGEPARQRAAKALEADLWTELTPAFVRRLQSLAEASAALLPSIPTFSHATSSRDFDGANMPFENLVIEHARRLEGQGTRGSTLATAAMTAALEDWRDRRFRHLAQHALSKVGEAARPLVGNAREALRAQDLAALSEARLAGQRSRRTPAQRPISLDEDLTSPQ